jgi:RNA polymerase sigma factor (sigma-70 family)
MRAASIPARAASVGPLRSRRLLALAGDARLVEQVRRGNDAAFEVVFERHGPAILGFCRHMVGSPEEAEDVVQHTFAAAYRDLQRDGEREIALKPWLFAIARNRCVSVLRARREVPVGADALDPGSGRWLAEQVEERAELRRLLADVRELPDEQRAALLLAELGELSHAEVASVLGCEVSRVKGLVFRARSALIARREAREAPCERIREQLANLRGGALRRTELRLHLRECRGCRAYREQVKQQRRMLAAALPVAPTLGMKASVLAAVGIGGGSAGGLGTAAGVAGGSAGGVSAASGVFGGSTVAKLAVAGVLAGGGAVAGTAVLESERPAVDPQRAAPAADGGAPRAGGGDFRPGGSADGATGRRGQPGAAQPGAETAHGGNGRGSRMPLQRGGERMGIGRGGERMGRRGGERMGRRGGERMGRGGRDGDPPAPARGRGPIDAPPASTPVRRGPPAKPGKPEPRAKAQPRGLAKGHGPQPPGSRAGAKPSPPGNGHGQRAKGNAGPKAGARPNGGPKLKATHPRPQTPPGGTKGTGRTKPTAPVWSNGSVTPLGGPKAEADAAPRGGIDQGPAGQIP